MHSQGQAGQPGVNVQEKGKNIYDLRSNVAVQKNVPPQRHFGSFIHASYSFDLATYCCNATHGKAFQETDEIHGGFAFSPPHLFPSPSMDTIYDQDLNEGENDNFDANTDAVQKIPALEAHGKPSAAPNAVAPAGTSPDVAAAAPASTPTDISTRNQLTGLDVVAALAAEQAPLGFVDDEETESADSTTKAGPSAAAALPKVDTAFRKEAPPTKQFAPFGSTLESTKETGPSKSAHHPSNPQATSAFELVRQSFRARIPTDLSDWDELAEPGMALLESEKDWMAGQVNPTLLKDVALHCLNRHKFYKEPSNSMSVVSGETLGKFQLAFFQLWGLTKEAFLNVSTQKIKKYRLCMSTCSY